jgi:Tfp pilus assembly protein PilN
VIENLNLASQPFRNRTLPWTLAVVIAAVSIAVLLFTLGQYRQTRARSLAVEAQVRALRTERESLKRQAEEVNSMLTEDQRRTLDAAHLILDRKNFSWSRLFADLESTLPQQVRVSRITVRDISQAGGRTRADLELAVAGRGAADVTRMMAQMASSGIFAADLLTQTPESRGGTGVEATLRVRYAPSAGRPAAAPPVEDTAGERAESPAAGVARAAGAAQEEEGGARR